MVAAALGGPVAVKSAMDATIDPPVSIEGPSEAAVGELVHLKVVGDNPSWLTDSPDVFIDGGNCYVSFRKAGEHEVIATAVSNGKTSIVKQRIVVGTSSPVVKDDPPITKSTHLTDKVIRWCRDTNAPKPACRELGDNFIDAASNTSSTDELMQHVAAANRQVNQRGVESVLANIQQHLFDELSGQDFEAHRCAFDEIGQGLLTYAGM